MSFPLEYYIEQAQKQGYSNEYIEAIKPYITKLQSNNLPIIFSRLHLAKCFHLSLSRLIAIIYGGDYRTPNYFQEIEAILSSPIEQEADTQDEEDDYSDRYYLEYRNLFGNYRFFRLKKKNKKEHREIMVPDNILKNIQRWILHYILKNVPLPEPCTGFRAGLSIKNNALPHINSNVILKLDLLKFFDNITEKRVYGLFKELGYHPNLAFDLAKLTTARHRWSYWNNFSKQDKKRLKRLVKEKPAILPQGAPTSPAIANLICRRMDVRLYKLAKKFNCNYTRYADDLTFSSKDGKLPPLKFINQIIQEEGFLLNHDKTRYLKQQKYITGLSVTDAVKVPRKFKKKIRYALYFCTKYDVNSYLARTDNEQKSFFKEWLAGSISFIYSIEPEVGKRMWIEYNKIDWSEVSTLKQLSIKDFDWDKMEDRELNVPF